MKNNSLVTVKNNREGRRFIATLRKLLRNTPKRAVLYGRGHRHGKEAYHQNLPHRLAQSFAVYIYDKPTFRMVRRVRVQAPTYEWVRVPTKWADKKVQEPPTAAPAFGHPDL
jgi:hypothetical protein